MSNQNQVTATGASGATYTFNTYPLETEFNPVGGIYIILNGNQPLYIGQTGNFAERFNDHHKEDAWLRHGATHMAAMVAGPEATRRTIETDLIRAYNPPCNG